MQLDSNQTDQVRPTIRTLQRICYALISGVVLAAAIFGLTADWTNLSTDISLLALIGAGLAAVLVAQSFVLPGLIAATSIKSIKANPKADRVKELTTLFQSKTIIRFAMLEGAAFLNTVLFFVDKNLIPLGVVVFIVAIKLTTIPSEHAALRWIEERLED